MSRESELAALLAMYQKKYGQLAAQTVKLIQQYLAEGYSAEKAIRLALGEANFFTVNREATTNAVTQAAALGYSVTNGEKYQAEAIRKIVLHEAWAPDKMTLSERLHGKQAQMRQEIIDTVSSAMRQGKSWVQASRDLYTGYSKGNVTNKAELPQYLEDLTVQAKRVLAGDKEAVKKYKAAIKKARRQIDKLAQDGAPTKTMKQAFQNLVDAAEELNAEALENSIMVAVEEKSRYIADRISRTEMARAWGDGFFAKHLEDPDVIAFRWKLNSRHPVFDICDIHAGVDMYGLGAGVYPKDRFPVRPAHPHCMCLVSPVYVGGIDMDGTKEAALLKGAKFNPAAVDKYIADLPRAKQVELLGVAGLKAWESGESWQNHLRLWEGHEKPGTRLKAEAFHPAKSNKDELSKMFTGDNITIPESKILDYALNKEHSVGGDKAVVFEKVLGYNKSNYQDLIKSIQQGIDKFPATAKGTTKFGQLVEVVMDIKGPTGKTAKVTTAWIIETGSTAPRLTSAYIKSRKRRE